MINSRDLSRFLETFTTKDKNSKFEINCDEQTIGYSATLIVQEKISEVAFIKDQPYDVIVQSMENMRKSILNNKLFDREREQLKDYEKLKNMKFVLEEIRKLDLNVIDKAKVEDDKWKFKNDQLNSYLGRK